MNTKPTYCRILILPAAAFFAGTLAFAQMQPGTPGQQPNAPSQQQQPAQPNAGGDAGATGGVPNNEAAYSDQAFLRQVYESDAAQVQMGQLAQEKSQSPDVKQLAQGMVMNRTRLDEQLKPLADKMSVEKPKQPAKKDREVIAKLETLSGPQFDEEYIKAVAKNNQKDVKDFNTEAQSSQNPTLQMAAKQDAPVLARHQEAIEQLAQKHNVTVAETK
jgi:putative membrane protein